MVCCRACGVLDFMDILEMEMALSGYGRFYNLINSLDEDDQDLVNLFIRHYKKYSFDELCKEEGIRDKESIAHLIVRVVNMKGIILFFMKLPKNGSWEAVETIY